MQYGRYRTECPFTLFDGAPCRLEIGHVAGDIMEPGASCFEPLQVFTQHGIIFRIRSAHQQQTHTRGSRQAKSAFRGNSLPTAGNQQDIIVGQWYIFTPGSERQRR